MGNEQEAGRRVECQAELESILAAAPDILWSVEILDVAAQCSLASWEPGRQLKTASVAKVFLLVEVAARLEEGSLLEEEPLDRRGVARVEDSGLWRHLRVNELPLVDTALLVAAVSDNWATNALLDRVGLPAVQERGRALGYSESRLEDYVRDVRGPDVPPTISLGRADDWAEMFARLHRRRLHSPAVDSRVEQWLRAGVDLSMVASAFRLDPLAHASAVGSFQTFNKTGTDEGVRADAGVVVGARPLAYCAIANWSPESDCTDAAMDGMHAIGRLIRYSLKDVQQIHA